jgi:hypothetical protein
VRLADQRRRRAVLGETDKALVIVDDVYVDVVDGDKPDATRQERLHRAARNRDGEQTRGLILVCEEQCGPVRQQLVRRLLDVLRQRRHAVTAPRVLQLGQRGGATP